MVAFLAVAFATNRFGYSTLAAGLEAVRAPVRFVLAENLEQQLSVERQTKGVVGWLARPLRHFRLVTQSSQSLEDLQLQAASLSQMPATGNVS